MKRISDHISYSEAISSAAGRKYGLPNKPNEEQLKSMMLVACKVFEPLRKHFNEPIYILSFFRSPEVNKKVGGSRTSQHMKGEAMDIQAKDGNNAKLFNYIKDNLDFDQLIWEFGTSENPDWVHVSYSIKNRKNVIRAKKVLGKTFYEPII
jgi:zinc D-Ala-D-Ala carboxypeptidase